MIHFEHLCLFCAAKDSLVPKSPLYNVLYYIPWLSLMAALKSLNPTVSRVFYIPLTIQVFQYVTPCTVSRSDVSKQPSAFIFTVKPSNNIPLHLLLEN
jgi:hypothetical protein